MNSTDIFLVIERIAADPGKLAKQALVQQHGANEHFRRVLDYGLNPFKNYGIRRLPGRTGQGTKDFDESHWALLDALRTRALTGNAARAALHNALNELNEPSATLLSRIITKDFRAGFSESTVNKAIPKFIPTMPYMRCSLPSDVDLATWPWADGVFSQLKADGMFCNVNVDQSSVFISTRQGQAVPLEALGPLVDEMLAHLKPGFQYHGEMLVQQLTDGQWKVLPRQVGNGLLNSVGQGGELPEGHRVVYMAWDRIPLDAAVPKGQHDEPIKDRIADLKAMLGAAAEAGSQRVGMVAMRIVYSLQEALEHYRELLGQGEEGTIIKRPDAPWKDGDSLFQVKLKLVVDVDLEIVGFTPGKGKNASLFGSITCRSSCGRLVVNVSGFKDKQRADINARRDALMGTIKTVRANSMMPPSRDGVWSLFLPRSVEFRQDKTVADSLERIKQQFDDAVKAGA